MGFVYRVLWILKALWIVLSETINILRNLHKKKRTYSFGMPQEFYHRFMYIAPSSGEPLPNLNLPFKWILWRFEVVSDVWSENAALFNKKYENSFKSTNIQWVK